MYQNGVDWDITGYDWYGDMALAYEARGLSAFASADVAYEKWGKDIIICETNHFSPVAIDEENPESWRSLYLIMKEAYKKDFVKGCTFYELLDESCFENENYYLGYAVAYGDTFDLKQLEFKKYPNEETYYPLVRKNDEEEGTGHNSVLEEDGRYYVFYHGRDINTRKEGMDVRTARICELDINDEIIKVINR
jgi:hypothetical protein